MHEIEPPATHDLAELPRGLEVTPRRDRAHEIRDRVERLRQARAPFHPFSLRMAGQRDAEPPSVQAGQQFQHLPLCTAAEETRDHHQNFCAPG